MLGADSSIVAQGLPKAGCGRGIAYKIHTNDLKKGSEGEHKGMRARVRGESTFLQPYQCDCIARAAIEVSSIFEDVKGADSVMMG